MEKEYKVWVVLRFLMALTFLWTFFDKLLGLGFDTAPENAWLAGGSPTFGFLKFGTAGPFSGIMQGMAGNPIVDTLFMVGLLGVGLSLLLGIGIQIGGYAGMLMMVLIWGAQLPKTYNPILDQHVIYATVLVGIAIVKPVKVGLGAAWSKLSLVQQHPVLE